MQGSTHSDDSAKPGHSFVIHVSITLPTTCEHGGAAPRAPPHPVVVLMNGFQMRASFYRAYAERLASWGFACVQYDTPLLKIVDDATELQYFEPLVQWLRDQNGKEGGFLHGTLNLERLAVTGHSRGGKLAGLLYAAGTANISTAFLIDPVDNTSETPESARYPSAIKALRKAGRSFGMLGAGHTGKCNPEGSNYKAFFGAAPDRSWQVIVPSAAHLQFLSAGSILDRLLRLLCPGGTGTSQEVAKVALPPFIAWMDSKLLPSPSQAELQEDFFEWVAAQQKQGQLVFATKHSGSTPTKADIVPEETLDYLTDCEEPDAVLV